MLSDFIASNRDAIVRRCRAKVAARSVPPPTEAEIDYGVPLFLDQLIVALRLGQSGSAEMSKTALLHGHELLEQGFSVSQVVHDYGDVCQSITELAIETNAPISSDDFRVLNACLDDAIASAVTQYGRETNQTTVDADADRENVRLGFFSHELRNLLNTALSKLETWGSQGAPGRFSIETSSPLAIWSFGRSTGSGSDKVFGIANTSLCPPSSKNLFQ